MTDAQPLVFVNLPVADIARARQFFSALGFVFVDAFSDENTLCMKVNPHAFYMLLSPARFAGFTDRPIAMPDVGVAAMHALSAPSREAVDTWFQKALAAGATDTGRVEEHGFMYGRSIHDLDGHRWECFWMDPAAVPPEG